jgi:predicted ATPase
LSGRAISAYERGLRQAPYRETLRQLVEALHLSAKEQEMLKAVVDRRRTPRVPTRELAESRVRSNLPLQATSFVGRKEEAADVRQDLEHARLLTLVGTAGCGKTRLAQLVACQLGDTYPDGVWLVELDRLPNSSSLPLAVAATLHIQEECSRPVLDTVVAALRGRRLLLVVDGCDWLPEASAEVARVLLGECPNVTILATSRHPLGALMERVRHVAPLGPSEAVQLFVERARNARPGFQLTRHNTSTIDRLCRRVDGIPLAIELVAARSHILSVDQIARSLDELFLLLRAGTHGLLPSPEALRGTLDWTDALLTDQQRALFHRLAVFVGTFEVDAVKAVAGSAIPGVDGWGFLQLHAVDVPSSGVSTVLELLTHLVEASLVCVDRAAGEPRYRLLETVRRYAAAKLIESGETPTARRRYRKWFGSLVEQAEAELSGPDQGVWLDRLERELDHIRWVIQDSAADTASLPDGLAMVARLRRLWIVRGHQGESRRLMELLMSATETAPEVRRSSASVRALSTITEVACWQGDYVAARRFATELVTIASTMPDQRAEWHAASLLARIRMHQGDDNHLRETFEEHLLFSRQQGDADGVVQALSGITVVARLGGDDEQAVTSSRESLTLARQSGDVWLMAQAATEMGLAYLQSGQYGLARKQLDDALRLRRELGDRMGTTQSLVNLGELAMAQGDPRLARLRFEEALAILRDVGDRSGRADVLGYLGRVATMQRDFVAAHACHAENLAVRRELGQWLAVTAVLEELATLARANGQDGRARILAEVAARLRRSRARATDPMPALS